MRHTSKLEAVPGQVDGGKAALEIQNARLAEALRQAELMLAIEASTARILSIALARGDTDPDPEAA